MTEKQREFVRVDYEPRDDYFAVRITNDDMKNAHIPNGAVVILHKQRYAKNGDIVLALHNGEQVLRYYKESGEDLYLTPANNELLPVAVKKTDDFLILGKVLEIRVEV